MHWLVYKYNNGKRQFVSGTDEYGYPIHTFNECDAWKFKTYESAACFFAIGYCLEKQYG